MSATHNRAVKSRTQHRAPVSTAGQRCPCSALFQTQRSALVKKQQTTSLATSLTAIAAACAMAGCGGNSDSPAATQTGVTISGVVASTLFVPGSATDPTIKAGYYQGALVCIDANANGKCDSTESPATTDAKDAFSLKVAAAGDIIVDIGTSATNTVDSSKVATRTVLRAGKDQIAEQGTAVVVSPLSSEVLRLMEANNSTYAAEKANLATRIGVSTDAVLKDFNTATG